MSVSKAFKSFQEEVRHRSLDEVFYDLGDFDGNSFRKHDPSRLGWTQIISMQNALPKYRDGMYEKEIKLVEKAIESALKKGRGLFWKEYTENVREESKMVLVYPYWPKPGFAPDEPCENKELKKEIKNLLHKKPCTIKLTFDNKLYMFLPDEAKNIGNNVEIPHVTLGNSDKFAENEEKWREVDGLVIDDVIYHDLFSSVSMDWPPFKKFDAVFITSDTLNRILGIKKAKWTINTEKRLPWCLLSAEERKAVNSH